MKSKTPPFEWTKSFSDAYDQLPPVIQKKVDRQLTQLSQASRYPSLRTQKLVNSHGIWEARIDYHYRITFERRAGVIRLLNLGTHDIYRRQ